MYADNQVSVSGSAVDIDTFSFGLSFATLKSTWWRTACMMSTDPNKPNGIICIAMKTREEIRIPMACPCTRKLKAKNCRQMGGSTNKLKAETRGVADKHLIN